MSVKELKAVLAQGIAVYLRDKDGVVKEYSNIINVPACYTDSSIKRIAPVGTNTLLIDIV